MTVDGLATLDARLALGARRADRIERLVTELTTGGAEAMGVPTDVTKIEEVHGLVEAAIRKFGRIDVIINNAGLMPSSPIERLKVADWGYPSKLDCRIRFDNRGLLGIDPQLNAVTGVAHTSPVWCENQSRVLVAVFPSRQYP